MKCQTKGRGCVREEGREEGERERKLHSLLRFLFLSLPFNSILLKLCLSLRVSLLSQKQVHTEHITYTA